MFVLVPAPNFEQNSLWLKGNGRSERETVSTVKERRGVQLNVMYVIPYGMSLGHMGKQPKERRHCKSHYYPPRKVA